LSCSIDSEDGSLKLQRSWTLCLKGKPNAWYILKWLTSWFSINKFNYKQSSYNQNSIHFVILWKSQI